MKICKPILVILFVLCIIDGLNGEFSSPSTLNIIKWCCVIIAIATYFICERIQKK
nr:MAG TPA: hypothetical protein [Bacteriophage sp.]